LFAFVALGAASPPPPDLPTVMVYPLMTSASIDRQTSGQIVTLLSDQIAQGGAIRVLPADLDTERSAYLASAKKAGAQFYVTGFLTPLGNGASIVEQVVSTQSGIVIYSNSGQVSSVADVRAKGDLLRTAILQDTANHGFAAFAAPPETATTAAPHNASTAVAPQANVSGLFHHRRAAATPAPAAAASPSPSPTP
jgi:hypothetical protein